MKTSIVCCLGAFFFLACSSPRPNPNMIADMDPVPIGTIELELEKFLSSSREKKEATVFFAPRIDAVYLEFKFQTVTYRQFWDRANRAVFVSALSSYRKDFDDQNLVLTPSKASGAYGRITGYIEWGQFNINILMSAKAYPRMELGYRFSGGSPYFTVLQRSAEDISETISETRESLNIRLYFTRAQAADLASMFDQDYLLSHTTVTARSGADPVRDTYMEAE